MLESWYPGPRARACESKNKGGIEASKFFSMQKINKHIEPTEI
jgi:hypothetical protein